MRQPEPWRRASKGGAWYAQIGRRQVRLAGPEATKEDAWRALHALRAAPREKPPAPGELTVREVICEFLLDRRRAAERGDLAAVTLEGYETLLARAALAFGHLGASQLRPLHVQAWVDSEPRWGPTRRHNAIGAVKACMRWAKRMGHVEVNPIADMTKPTPRRRETALGGETVKAILGATRDRAFRDFLEALWATGCRPGELARLTAAMLREGTWEVPNKTRGQTGEPTRAIYPTPEVFARSAELAKVWTAGPIYRNARGRPWTRNALACRFARLRRKGLVARGEVPYSLRHGWITDALERGVPIATVAELAGHKDATMIFRVYSKLSKRRDYLKEEARRVRPE